MDITSFVLGYKKGKAEGGGALTEPVCHVTFMNGDTVLYEKPVFVGDDCTDIVKKGTIGTPSKASTPQYSYTYTGWSMTNGGEASTDALAAVTEDRKVYAAYTSAVRYYTITYLDDDGTVLKTESLAYGTMPSYVPTRDEYNLDTWNPAPVAVTGDATYTAVWVAKPKFESMAWADISAITTAGTSAQYFAVGQTKKETITYTDGTTEELEFAIAKIRDDGSMVLVLTHALSTLKPMDASATAPSNYYNNDLGDYLVNTVLVAFPDDLRAVLRSKEVMFAQRYIRLITNYNITSTSASTSANYEPIPLLSTAAKRIRKSNGTAVKYWISKFNMTNSNTTTGTFYYVDTTGNISSYAANCTSKYGVVFLIDV